MSADTIDRLNGQAAAAFVDRTFGRVTTTAVGVPLLATPTSGAADGIFTDSGAAGESASIATAGVWYLKVNGNSENIAAGDFLKPTTAGVGIKAGNGEVASAVALEPATADAVYIRVRIVPRGLAANSVVTSATSSSATPTALTVADLRGGTYNLTLSYAGAVALTIPSAGTVQDGALLAIYKTGSAGAITITVAAGTIDSHTNTTYAAIDADKDYALFRANQALARWDIVASKIA